MSDLHTSSTAKALKVIAALRTLAGEYAGQRDAVIADRLSKVADMAMEDLSRLHDLIAKHDTTSSAVAELDAA